MVRVFGCMMVILALLAGCGGKKTLAPVLQRAANPNRIDQITLGDLTIDVSFFDPSVGIKNKHPLYETFTIEKRADLWQEYLHSVALYLFEAKDSKGATVRYYCLRGNPARMASSIFLELETIEPGSLDLQNPDRLNYAANIRSRADVTALNGYLYEHMAEFQNESKAKYIGKDVLYFGRSYYVIAYQEICSAVMPLIAADLGIQVSP
jgi:hypothetical protein